jgi:hypothetical protein
MPTDSFESCIVGESAEGPKFLLVGQPAEYNVMLDQAKTCQRYSVYARQGIDFAPVITELNMLAQSFILSRSLTELSNSLGWADVTTDLEMPAKSHTMPGLGIEQETS